MVLLTASLSFALGSAGYAKSKSKRKKAQTAKAAAAATALRARAKFKAKKFVLAAKLFMKAYSQEPLPPLVYNAARAYEEAGKAGQAIGLFRLYISISKSERGRKTAKAHMAKLQAAGQPAAEVATKPGSSATAANRTTASGTAAPAAAPTAVVARASAPAAWPRWVATGAGVVGLAAGVALLVSASGDSEDAANLPVTSQADIKTYNSRFDDAERLWAAGVAVTAIGVGLGAWATWLHLTAGTTRSALELNAGPRHAMLTYHF